MKLVNVPSGEMPAVSVISFLIFVTALSMGDGLHENEKTLLKITNGYENTNEHKRIKSSALGARWKMMSLSHYKTANRKPPSGNLFLKHVREAGQETTFSHIGSSRSKEKIGKWSVYCNLRLELLIFQPSNKESLRLARYRSIHDRANVLL